MIEHNRKEGRVVGVLNDVVFYLMVAGVLAGIFAVGYIVRKDRKDEQDRRRIEYEATRIKPHKPRY